MKVPSSLDYMRLDKVLSFHENCQNMGLRGRRRLCDEGFVLVNGIERNMSYKVRANDEIEVRTEKNTCIELKIKPYIVNESSDFIAFYKPKNLPTAEIKGRNVFSLERYLYENNYKDIILLNRLDTLTCGLVLGAKNIKASLIYRNAQENCLTEKKYMALIEGILEENTIIKWTLDCSKPQVKCLYQENPIRNQHTKIEIQKIQEAHTLVECTIYKGQRHQIRCHLGSIGHPLVADSLYGAKPLLDTEPYLCHYSIEFSEFSARLNTCEECAITD